MNTSGRALRSTNSHLSAFCCLGGCFAFAEVFHNVHVPFPAVRGGGGRGLV